MIRLKNNLLQITTVKDLDKIKKVLEIRASCHELEKCAVCGAKTENAYFYSKSSKDIGNLLCRECNQLEIQEDDVKGNAVLEYLYKRALKKQSSD